jgi:ABC-2 type transport system ATP-binding protein
MDPIEVKSLRKSYGAVEAVRGVTFSVAKGSIYGLIGPDGAGKTTIMRSIVSLLSIDGGELRFMGRLVDAEPGFVRSHIGYMPQRFSLYQDLSVEENLRFFGDLFAVPHRELAERISRLYEFSGLEPFKARRAAALSGGMKQKLALSCMLVHAPEVIVLDEPTFGVDPVSRNEFWTILRSLAAEGTTILVSTAYMDEALLCDRVALVYRGQLLANDLPAALIAAYTGQLWLARTESPHRVYDVLQPSTLCGECNLFGEGVHLTLAPGIAADDLEDFLRERGVDLQEFHPVEASLEDLFLKLMKD